MKTPRICCTCAGKKIMKANMPVPRPVDMEPCRSCGPGQTNWVEVKEGR